MRKLSLILVITLLLSLSACSDTSETSQIVATTKPVYDLTYYLCADTDLSVGLLISESISCLHDYSLSVAQVRNVEAAEVVVLSGAGLEDFMSDLLEDCDTVIDSSVGVPLLECTEQHEHNHHHHEADAHIWMDPRNAKIMAENICHELEKTYPQYAEPFRKNLISLVFALDSLQAYGEKTLSSLSCREMITFHDGFGYFADAFDLTIAAAVEEESGGEASAKELIHLIELMQKQSIPAVFTEVNGSVSAAKIICAEIGASSYALDMGMNGDYFTTMYQNINTVKEALG